MKPLLIYTLIIASMAMCQKDHKNCCPGPGIPSCVQKRIEEIKKQPKWNPPAEVSEYLYNGQKVYLFTADCCDQFISLVDANCNSICAPSGGIAGKGDGKCPDFYDKAQFLRQVWKDNR